MWKWSSAKHFTDAGLWISGLIWIYFNNDMLQIFNMIELWRRIWVPCSWSTHNKFNVVLATVSQIMRDVICDFLRGSKVRKMVGLGTFLLYITLCNLEDLYIIWSTNKVSLYHHRQSLIWLHLAFNFVIKILTLCVIYWFLINFLTSLSEK